MQDTEDADPLTSGRLLSHQRGAISQTGQMILLQKMRPSPPLKGGRTKCQVSAPCPVPSRV